MSESKEDGLNSIEYVRQIKAATDEAAVLLVEEIHEKGALEGSKDTALRVYGYLKHLLPQT